MTDDLDFKINLNPNNNDNTVPSSTNATPKYAPRDSDQPEQPQPKKGGFFSFFSVEFYQPYFDVTTAEVKERLLSSIDPRNNTFFEKLDGRPDLYGPFWVCTTLIFILAAAGNFSGFISAGTKANIARFDFIPTATSIVPGLLFIYGFGLGVPIIFTILLKWFGSSSVQFINTICIYGYSLFILNPVFILSIIPYSVAQWIFLIVGTGSSAWFLINNYANELSKYVGNKRYILLGFIGASQFILLLIFKLTFFDTVYESK